MAKSTIHMSDDTATLERYSAALLRIIATGDACLCDRHGGCGCGHAAANIARDALTAKGRTVTR